MLKYREKYRYIGRSLVAVQIISQIQTASSHLGFESDLPLTKPMGHPAAWPEKREVLPEDRLTAASVRVHLIMQVTVICQTQTQAFSWNQTIIQYLRMYWVVMYLQESNRTSSRSISASSSGSGCSSGVLALRTSTSEMFKSVSYDLFIQQGHSECSYIRYKQCWEDWSRFRKDRIVVITI